MAIVGEIMTNRAAVSLLSQQSRVHVEALYFQKRHFGHTSTTSAAFLHHPQINSVATLVKSVSNPSLQLRSMIVSDFGAGMPKMLPLSWPDVARCLWQMQRLC